MFGSKSVWSNNAVHKSFFCKDLYAHGDTAKASFIFFYILIADNGFAIISSAAASSKMFKYPQVTAFGTDRR